MAKHQLRSTKEAKKPKKVKQAAAPAEAGFMPMGKTHDPSKFKH